MKKVDGGRRRVLTALPALAGAPWVLRHAHAQDVGAYQNAKINWRQAEGESITVAVIPAGYFDVLAALTPEFEALTGVKVRYDKVKDEDRRHLEQFWRDQDDWKSELKK